MRVDIDSGGYTSACSYFYDANHTVVDAVSTCSAAIDGGGGMAGTDTGGAAFAQQYDAAAGPLIRAGADMGEAMAQMANLLNGALKNHEGADFGARLAYTPSGYGPGADDGDADPDHWTETVSCPTPPSAAGGTGSQPGWWHWLASHVDGLLWPDADTSRLREVGAGWTTASQSLDGATYLVDDARWEIAAQTSPEVADATATCDDLSSHLTALCGAYQQMGQACRDYADQVDAHHKEIEDELASFIKWTAVIEGGGFFLGLATAGLGELAAQAGEGAEIANAAAKVVKVLKDLLELAKAAALKVGDLVKTATAALERVRVILNARLVRALEKIAPGLTRESRKVLLEELEAAGVKHDPGQIVTIFRNADGKIVFLEKGDAQRGLAHIVGEHGGEFAAKGVTEKEIPDLLQTAVKDGKVIGYQGKGTGRPIYEVLYHGKLIKVAITIGSNGYIVGANLR